MATKEQQRLVRLYRYLKNLSNGFSSLRAYVVPTEMQILEFAFLIVLDEKPVKKSYKIMLPTLLLKNFAYTTDHKDKMLLSMSVAFCLCRQLCI